jgi:hypothetical protein
MDKSLAKKQYTAADHTKNPQRYICSNDIRPQEKIRDRTPIQDQRNHIASQSKTTAKISYPF